ncbi:MAG: flagellar basal body rod protein FlgB [Planctomycetes bacterium]|nr:flagellar basal body rod protein FlgB [Planctomycetota bacterium]
MFNTMFDKGSLPVLEQWLHFTVVRHRAIANNIANVETPFYKTMDAPEKEFRRVMLRAFDEQKRSPLGIFDLVRRDGIVPKPGARPEMRYIEAPPEEAGMLRHVENNVDVDVEFAKMVKNSGLHNLLANVLTQQFDLMREAIGERVR